MAKSAKSLTTSTRAKAVKGEPEKSIAHIIVEIIEYVPDKALIKTILKKSAGNISLMTFESSEGLAEKASPFDTYAQVIEGKATIIINKVSHVLTAGQGTVIPARSGHYIHPDGGFKMILTTINSFPG